MPRHVMRNLRFFRAFCLVTDLAGVSESGGNTKLWKDIKLEQDPDKENR